MTYRSLLSCVLAALALGVASHGHAADEPLPRPRFSVDAARAKAQEAERQRLLAKLRNETPKVEEAPPPAYPLAAPIFHRHDRP